MVLGLFIKQRLAWPKLPVLCCATQLQNAVYLDGTISERLQSATGYHHPTVLNTSISTMSVNYEALAHVDRQVGKVEAFKVKTD